MEARCSVTERMNAQTFVFQAGSPRWSAVFSLFMGVTALISAEFIPVSLLTPIARELAVSEGAAGQTVTAVGIFAVLSSLLLAPLTGGIDRRRVLLTLSALLVASYLLIGAAPNYAFMLAGRALLGVCVGGFWSLASAVTLQLVPTKDVPRALSIVYAGVSVATIISLPVASWIGELIGWRNVFFLGALMGTVGFIWQYRALPVLPARPGNGFREMFSLLGRKWVLAGIGGNILSFGGYHVFFTYLRPFLELDLARGTDDLSLILLVFGIVNVLGTFIAGAILGRYFRTAMITVHLAFMTAAMALLLCREYVNVSIALAVFWGFAFGFTPVGWSTWIARTLADKAELAGGLTVAATQFAIGLAAAVGGFTYDNQGISGIFLAAAGINVLAALLIAVSFSLFAKAAGRKA